MTIDAIALLKLPFDQVSPRLASQPGSSAIKLDDGVAIRTRLPFGSEPDEFAVWLRRTLGELYDQHDDARGFYVYPDVAHPKATTYAAVIDELGEVGEWAPRVAAGYVAKPVAPPPVIVPQPSAPSAGAMNPGSMQDSARELMNALGADTMAQLEQAMASGDMGALQKLQGQLEAMLEQNPGLAEQLQQTAQAAGLEGPGDMGNPLAAMGGGSPFGLPSEEDAPELWAQARAQAEAMMRDNPELLAQLQAQFGGMMPPGDDTDDEADALPTPPTPTKK